MISNWAGEFGMLEEMVAHASQHLSRQPEKLWMGSKMDDPQTTPLLLNTNYLSIRNKQGLVLPSMSFSRRGPEFRFKRISRSDIATSRDPGKV